VFASVSQARSTSTDTLGATLERDRRREPPRHIRKTIADFETQSAAMNARLGALDGR
jgi:hypothetical protein